VGLIILGRNRCHFVASRHLVAAGNPRAASVKGQELAVRGIDGTTGTAIEIGSSIVPLNPYEVPGKGRLAVYAAHRRDYPASLDEGNSWKSYQRVGTGRNLDFISGNVCRRLRDAT